MIPPFTKGISMGRPHIYRLLVVMLLPLALGACVATTTAVGQPFYNSIDSRYAPALGEEYKALAVLMRVNQQDLLAEKFHAKAAEAGLGRWIYPEAPGMEATLNQAHDDLTGALMFLMSPENASWLAKAQANYDCWAGGSPDDGCRRNFEVAMRSLSIPESALKTEAVYFGDDSSVLDQAAHTKLETVANQARMNKAIAIALKGHSGGGDQNQSLALRRAIAIRNVLAQMGVDPARISVDGEAHSDTILGRQKAEAGTDPKTHRVDIIMQLRYGQEI